MRTLWLVSIMLGSGLLAGCLDDAADAAPEGAAADDHDHGAQMGAFEPFVEAFDVSVLVGLQPLGPNDPARAAWMFEVPEGAMLLTGGGDWSCITMCPLEVTLVDPDGNTTFQAAVWGWETVVEAPQAGTWTLSIATGQMLTAGDTGELTVTIE